MSEAVCLVLSYPLEFIETNRKNSPPKKSGPTANFFINCDSLKAALRSNIRYGLLEETLEVGLF